MFETFESTSGITFLRLNFRFKKRYFCFLSPHGSMRTSIVTVTIPRIKVTQACNKPIPPSFPYCPAIFGIKIFTYMPK